MQNSTSLQMVRYQLLSPLPSSTNRTRCGREKLFVVLQRIKVNSSYIVEFVASTAKPAVVLSKQISTPSQDGPLRDSNLLHPRAELTGRVRTKIVSSFMSDDGFQLIVVGFWRITRLVEARDNPRGVLTAMQMNRYSYYTHNFFARYRECCLMAVEVSFFFKDE